MCLNLEGFVHPLFEILATVWIVLLPAQSCVIGFVADSSGGTRHGRAAAREEQNGSLDLHLSSQQLLVNACTPGAVDLAVSCTHRQPRGAALQTLRCSHGVLGGHRPQPGSGRGGRSRAGAADLPARWGRGRGFAGGTGIDDCSGSSSCAPPRGLVRVDSPSEEGLCPPVPLAVPPAPHLSSPTRTERLAHRGSSCRQRVFKGAFLTSPGLPGRLLPTQGNYFPLLSVSLSLSLLSAVS